VLYYVKRNNYCGIFINPNINVNVRDSDGNTPLHILVKGHHFAECKSLLDNYTPLFLENDDHRTAFYLLMEYYCSSNFFDSNLIELFLQAGADITEAQDVLNTYYSSPRMRSFIETMAEKYPPLPEIKEPEC
jgi:hypothetical protein